MFFSISSASMLSCWLIEKRKSTCEGGPRYSMNALCMQQREPFCCILTLQGCIHTGGGVRESSCGKDARLPATCTHRLYQHVQYTVASQCHILRDPPTRTLCEAGRYNVVSLRISMARECDSGFIGHQFGGLFIFVALAVIPEQLRERFLRVPQGPASLHQAINQACAVQTHEQRIVSTASQPT